MIGAIIIVLVAVSGCRETDFVVEDEPTSEVTPEDDDVKGKIEPTVAEPLPKTGTVFELPVQRFTLNPQGEERSESIAIPKQLELTMESLVSYDNENLHSPSRPHRSQSFVQTGHGGEKYSQNFSRQHDKGLLDLLMVVDDSDSMIHVHNNLKSNLSKLLQNINNSNWRIAIVDVEDSNCNDMAIVNSSNQRIYMTTLDSLKNSPNKDERTLQKAKMALGLIGGCRRWMRDNSTLAAIIITDEDHQCRRSNRPDNYISDDNSFYCDNEVQDFITEFRQLRSSRSKLFGIFRTNTTCRDARARSNCFAKGNNSCYTNACFNREDHDLYGARNFLNNIRHLYDRVADIKGNYSTILTNISSGIRDILQDQFTLSATPDRNNPELEVWVNNIKQTSGYQLAGNILTFTNDPGGDNITINYWQQGQTRPRPYLNTLTVNNEADMETVTVSINNRILARNSDYTVNGHNIVIGGNIENVFPSGNTATVSYHPRQQKTRVFHFANGRELVPNSVQVSGASGNFRLHNNRLEFDAGQEPDYGANFSVNYRYYREPRLTYPTNVSWQVARVSCDNNVSCQLNGDNIVVEQNSFRRGRITTVTLHPAQAQTAEQNDRTAVPVNYVVGSLRLEHDGQSCSERQLVIDNGMILLKTANATDNGCQMLDSTDAIMQLHYRPYTPQQKIEVSGKDLVEYIGQYNEERWEVSLAGQKLQQDQDYTIDLKNRTITFSGEQDVNATVQVKIYLEE